MFPHSSSPRLRRRFYALPEEGARTVEVGRRLTEVAPHLTADVLKRTEFLQADACNLDARYASIAAPYLTLSCLDLSLGSFRVLCLIVSILVSVTCIHRHSSITRPAAVTRRSTLWSPRSCSSTAMRRATFCAKSTVA